MNYPDWAPQNLVGLHLHRLKKPSVRLDTEQQVTQIRKEFKDLSDQQIEKTRADLNRKSFFLPEKEGTKLLGKLITDQRMKAVWASIARRVKNEIEFVNFWTSCDSMIQSWRWSQKLSTTQHRKHFQKIHEQASALSQMMNVTAEFQYYSTVEQIEADSIKWLLENLDASPPGFKDENKSIDYTSFCLHQITPSIHAVLNDIAVKALMFSKEEPVVRKPNSENAAIHYFVRTLSEYLKTRYAQPLHEVVAVTTEVVFDQENIDTDYVRKLVG